MRKSRDWLATHTVTVETYTSEGFNGAGFAAPVVRPCGIEETSELSRDDAGDETTISGRLFCTLEELPYYTSESRLTIRPGRTARVVGVDVFDSRDPALTNLDHIEVKYV